MLDYDNLLNEQQLRPVKCTEGPVLVLAGAGTGKTRVLTHRIAYLIEHNHVQPYNILAITFTNKAANEMKERLNTLVGADNLWVSTFHSFCARLLRYDIDKLEGYTSNFSIYTDSDSDKLVQRIIKSMEVDDNELKKVARSYISLAKNTSLNPKKYLANLLHPKAELIFEVYCKYEEELHRANALDFDDLLLKTVLLFDQHREVLEKYQDRFRYIHVDEFQDTNKIQYTLIRLLAFKHRNLFVVGDDDQSIYGWRGAEVENILNFNLHYKDARVFKLEENYRSTSNILNCANTIIANNPKRMGKELWTSGTDGMKVQFHALSGDRDEADYVIGEIESLRSYNEYKNSDFAILVRANSITRTFEERLNMYSIPYKIYGGFKFYERKEVKDYLAYLRMLINPKDNEAIFRIINFPKRGIGEVLQKRLLDTANNAGVSLMDVILHIEDYGFTTANVNKVKVFRTLINELNMSLHTKPLNEFVDDSLKLIAFETDFDANIQDELNKLDNIRELAASIKLFYQDNKENVTLEEYLQQLALISDTDDMGEEDVVTIATVHSVKGLEFRCVFVVGLEEGIFPSIRKDENPDDIEEERRIMYVAVTRARERLYLTCASSRFRYNRVENNTVSRFVEEAGLYTPKPRNTNSYGDNLNDIFGDFGESLPSKKETSKYDIAPSFMTKINNTPKPVEKDISKYKVGMKVKHMRFGIGTIKSISGENADIEFDKLGIKTFCLRLAKMEIVG